MSILRQKTAPVREKRIDALSAWSGTAASLVAEASNGSLEQRIRTYAQDLPSDIEHALELLRTIEGLAVVVHGPAGCSATLQQGSTLGWTTTNLDERDSIMGADAKLRKAILDTHRSYAPKAVAVVSTPVVAINNDDIGTVVDDLREELSIPVFAVWTDGFRSKIGSSGRDVAVHALAKNILPLRRRGEGEHVALLTVGASRGDVRAVRSLLERLGVDSVVFPRFGSVAEAQRVAEARLTVAIDSDESDYAGLALEDALGIPFLRAPAPVGLAGTAAWLRAVAAKLGLEERAEALIATEQARLEGILHEARSIADGATLFANLPVSQAFALAEASREFGASLVGLKATWISARHAEAASSVAPELPILVGEGQFFEEANLLGRLRPGLYVTSGSAPVHALRSGIPVLDLEARSLLGWDGLEHLALGAARALANTALARFLAEGSDEPYDSSWLKKSVHWYIKHEVK